MFNKVCIAGAGLIGGSFALAGRKKGLFGSVACVTRSEKSAREARRIGFCDQASTNLLKMAKDADLLFIAAPVGQIAQIATTAAPCLADGAIITDAGSVKGAIVERLESSLPSSVSFIGGHPVAGTENAGPASALSSLYDDKYCIVTQTEKSDSSALEKVVLLWESIGMKVVKMTPDRHDKALALISHLPHVVAYTLVESLIENDHGEGRAFIAGGFKDTTRIAQSSASMWSDIFKENKKSLLAAIDGFEERLASMKKMIEQDDFDRLANRLLVIAKERRDMNDKS